MQAMRTVSALGIALVVVVSTAAFGGYVEEVLSDNPVAYWRFEEGNAGDIKPSGSAATDMVGAHGGTYQNGVPLVAGALPGTMAADFDGASDYVTTTTLGSFGSTLNTGSTLEFWVKTTESRTVRQAMGVLNQADSTAFVVDFNRDSNMAGSLNRYNFYLRAADGKRLSTDTLNPAYRDGTWHHMAWVVDDPSSGNTAHIYFDGVEISQGKVATTPTTFTNLQFPFMIGANNNRGTAGTHTDAAIDEVAVYDQPLSASRIAEHYAARTAASALPVGGDLILHLDADFVTTDAGKVASWNDLSGQGNHATQNVDTGLRPTPIPGALNGHQVVRFEHEDIMDMTSLSIGTDATILMVTQNQGQTSGGSIHRTVMAPRNTNPEPYGPAGNGYALGYYRDGADAFNVSLGNGTAEQKVTHSLADNGQMELVIYRHAGTTGELLRDAELVATGSHSRTSDFATGYSIGRQAGNAGRGYQGDIAEVVVYDRVLTPDEYHQVGFYLDQKYDLGVQPYELRVNLDYRNYAPSSQTWQDAGLLNNDAELGQSAANTTWDPAPGYRGFVFDPASSGDELTIQRSPSLNIGNIGAGADLSVEFWAEFEAMDAGRTLIDTRESSGHGWLLKQDHTDRSKLNFWFRTSDGQTREFISDAGALTIDGLMHHIGVILDAEDDGTGTLKFYVDGLLVGEQAYTGVSGDADSTFPFRIGHQAHIGTGLVPFDGDIGLFRLWATALSADDVMASYVADFGYYAPEPATLTLLGLGALALLRRRRRA